MKPRCLGLACIAFALTALANDVPEYIASAVENSNRPEADRQRDINRKPGAVIAFAGLKPGDKIADFMPRRGYFTKIFCKIVGDAGRVFAVSVPRQATITSSPALSAAPTSEAIDGCTNATAITLKSRNFPAPELHSDNEDPGWVYEYYASRMPVESFNVPEPLDMIWTSENYHDLHNKSSGSPNMQYVNTALLSALKPGGILIVEDHAAEGGSGMRDTEILHRIDVEQVKREVTLAGFEFVAENHVLGNKDDLRTTKVHEMHDKTDRFLLKFRRPL